MKQLVGAAETKVECISIVAAARPVRAPATEDAYLFTSGAVLWVLGEMGILKQIKRMTVHGWF